MSEMIKRVAAAIGGTYDGYVDPKDTPNSWARAMSAARAAIEAMREPDHAMFLAGRELALSGSDDDLMNRDSVKQRWRVMIDAALVKVDA